MALFVLVSQHPRFHHNPTSIRKKIYIFNLKAKKEGDKIVVLAIISNKKLNMKEY